jgi:hypothetical protein
MPHNRTAPAKTTKSAMREIISVLMRGQIERQAGKITLFRVTGEVRSYIGILRVSNEIKYQRYAYFLSKNALVCKNPSINASSMHIDQSRPAT